MFDRYALFDELASGGMAAVHLGLMHDAAGRARAVAIKRMHPHIAREPEFRKMFLDEARVVARIRHPNVVTVVDVAQPGTELWLVMEYVHGETLASLGRAVHGSGVPAPIAASIVAGVLRGLHAAHEATSEYGQPLLLVHRDVSPQNIIVGRDGVARVVDFGIAKAVGRLHTTRDGSVKGKAAYMAPEQLRGQAIDRRVDVYASAIVLWETLTARRLFDGESPEEKVTKILEMKIEPPSRFVAGVPPALDAVVLQGLSRKREARFATALEMAEALERAGPPASAPTVGSWLASVAGAPLEERARRIRELETGRPPPFTAPGLETGSPAAPAVTSGRGRRRAAGFVIALVTLSGAAAISVVRLRARAPARLPSTTQAQAPISSPSSPPAAPAAPEPGAPTAPGAPVVADPAATGATTPPPRRRPAARPPRTAAPAAASTGFTKDRHE